MRLINAQAKSEQLVIRLTNFVFIVLVSFCLSFLVLAFFDSSLLSCHFWPFNEVVRKIPPEVTRKVERTADYADVIFKQKETKSAKKAVRSHPNTVLFFRRQKKAAQQRRAPKYPPCPAVASCEGGVYP
jgi:hypothetical protein